MNDSIRSICKSLRLAYVSDIYENIQFNSPSEYLEVLFKEEIRLREKAKVQRLIKNAKFLDSKSLSNYEWTERIRFSAQIDKEGLMSLEFIKKKQNVVLIGAPGTGKSYLATGLGRKACKMGYAVKFFRVSLLTKQLEQAFRQGKLPSYRKNSKK